MKCEELIEQNKFKNNSECKKHVKDYDSCAGGFSKLNFHWTARFFLDFDIGILICCWMWCDFVFGTNAVCVVVLNKIN